MSDKNKILIIWHAAVVEEYRARIRAIAEHSAFETTLLVPQVWCEHSARGDKLVRNKKDTRYRLLAVTTTSKKNSIIYLICNKLVGEILKKPQIIHLHEEPYSLVALQTIFLAKILSPKTKLIVESARGSYFRLPWVFRIILRYVLNNIDILYARSVDVAELYKKRFGYKGRILVVPNGVSKTEKLIRAKKNVKTIGFVGKIAKHKGVDVLVEAFKKMTGNYRLLLVGKNELNIKSEKNVVVVGPVKHFEVEHYLKQMDLFVLPSITANKWIDTFPRVLIEAMALGIPVLGSSSGEIPRIIGRNDLVFKENNVAALYQKLNSVLKDGQKLKNIGNYCRERVEQNYTWAKVSEIIVSGYSEVLKK